jgi:hypothetical protein
MNANDEVVTKIDCIEGSHKQQRNDQGSFEQALPSLRGALFVQANEFHTRHLTTKMRLAVEIQSM